MSAFEEDGCSSYVCFDSIFLTNVSRLTFFTDTRQFSSTLGRANIPLNPQWLLLGVAVTEMYLPVSSCCSSREDMFGCS